MQYNYGTDPYAGYNPTTGQYDYSSYYTSGYNSGYGAYPNYVPPGYDAQPQISNSAVSYNASTAYSTPPPPPAVPGVQTTQPVVAAQSPTKPAHPKKPKPAKPPAVKDVTPDPDAYCDVCVIQCASVSAYNNHCRGMMHSQKVMEKDKDRFELPPGTGEESTETTAMETTPSTFVPPPSTFVPPPTNHNSYGGGNNSYGGNKSYGGYPTNTSQVALGYGEMDSYSTVPVSDPSGGNVNPDEQFYCDVCECSMTGPRNFADHTKGARHKKNVEHREMGESISKSKGKGKVTLTDVDQFGKELSDPPRIQSLLDDTMEPLLGLQFVTEFISKDPSKEARYVCNLCESKCDPRTLVPHLTGNKHRLNYLEEKHPQYHSIIKQKTLKKSEMSPIIDDYSRTVESEEGRRPITVKEEIDVPEGVLPSVQQVPKKSKLNPNTMAFHDFNKRNADYAGLPTHLGGGNKKAGWSDYNAPEVGSGRGRGGRGGNNSGYAGGVGGYAGGYGGDGYGGYGGYDTQSSGGGGFVGNTMFPSSADYNRGGGGNQMNKPGGGGFSGGSSFVSNKNATSASSAMADLLSNMSESLVSTEEEAAMALQVSNALTQALLKFRMKGKWCDSVL